MRRISNFHFSVRWFSTTLLIIALSGIGVSLFASFTTAQAAGLELPQIATSVTCTDNLIKNPDFENDAAGSMPAGWSGSGMVVNEASVL